MLHARHFFWLTLLADDAGDINSPRNRMHRTKSALTIFLLALFSTITIGSAVSGQTAPDRPQPVLDVNSMDTSVDPCTDFFAYSCGNWIKKNPIPPDQTSWSVYSKLEDDNKSILREI